MPANPAIQKLIEELTLCDDDQPNDAQLAEFRRVLERKVTTMKRRGRTALYGFFAGIAIIAFGAGITILAAERRQMIQWLAATGFGIVIAGALVVVASAIGLLIYRGFGYVWARHDYHDATLLELSRQVEQLTVRLNAIEK